MADYRRFIAYVYEYRKGKKENNCGFMKVEVRNENCTIEIHLHIDGLTMDEECKIYGFLRKEGLMHGILLGNCKTVKDGIECLLETDALNMGGSGIGLGKMGGVIFVTDSGGFFGTEWDDQAIRPENFKEIKISQEENHKMKPADTQNVQNEREENREENIEQSIKQNIEQEVKEKEKHESEEGEMQIEEPKIEEPKTKELQKEEIPKEEIHIQSVLAENTQSPSVPKVTLSFGQEFCPFTDSDFHQCWKIHPQDLVHFPRRQCALRNNRFLQYGYYHFGHLLLCRRGDGKYILGVPGSYDQQEQFMAGMFGFSCFKESREIKVEKGRGGYWYRFIDPPAIVARESHSNLTSS